MSLQKKYLLDFSQGTLRPSKSLSLVELMSSPRNRLKPKNQIISSLTHPSNNQNEVKQKIKIAFPSIKVKSDKNKLLMIHNQYGFIKQQKPQKKTLTSTSSSKLFTERKKTKSKKQKSVSKSKLIQPKTIVRQSSSKGIKEKKSKNKIASTSEYYQNVKK